MKQCLRYAFVIGVLIVLGIAGGGARSAVAAAPAADRSSAFESVPCSTFKITNDEFECGYISVPEVHALPDGKQIKLGVAILPSTGTTPTRDAFVMSQGGPGGSTLDLFTQFLELDSYPALQNLRADRDIVLYDQRGTLYSQPALLCPEELDQTLSTIEQALSPEEEAKASEQAALACRNRLVQSGVNLAAYNSFENARDIEDVRRALGYDKFDYYGISYGTLLALQAMREIPNTFRSVVLDAVVPPQINPNVTVAQSQNRAFEELFRLCAADAACNHSYPDLKKVFYDQVDALNKQPAHVHLTDSDTGKSYNAVMDGNTYLDLLFQFIYNSELLPALPKMIYDASAGDYNLIEVYYPLFLFDRTFASGMYYSVMCAEDADFTLDDLQLDGVDSHIAAAQKRDTATFLALCNQWNVPQLGPKADEPVTSTIPTLILSGDLDPITPPPFGQAAAATITPSYPLTFPAYGHGAITSGECPNEIIAAFVQDPQKPPNAACIKDTAQISFITPANYLLSSGVGRMQAAMLQGNLGPFWLPLGLLAVLFSVFIVAPIMWIVRRSKHLPASPSRLARLTPWFAALASVLLVLFVVALFVLILIVALRNENTTGLVLGAPRNFALLFVLPLLFAIASILVMVGAINGWLSGNWSLWRRVYYAAVALAAVGLTVWLAVNGVLTIILA